jgi:hypothetical protein
MIVEYKNSSECILELFTYLLKKYFANKVFFILLFCLAINAQGQNFIPNDSFESYSTCPSGSFVGITLATSWINPNIGTPDYFNKCSTYPNFDVPKNFVGIQPARTGSAYAGLGTIAGHFTYREYIEVPLTSALIKDSCYHFEMYLSLGDTSRYLTDEIGIYFSDTVIKDIQNYATLSYSPQIKISTANVNDTVNWHLVEGDYCFAKGSEKYIVIGNFNEDANTDTTIIYSNSKAYYCYFYIDDVSLTLSAKQQIKVNAGADKIVCSNTTVQLGTPPQYGLTYTWQPATGLSNANAAQPTASPAATTTYILTINDTANYYACILKASDTVKVFYNSNFTVDAGNTKTINCGNTTQLNGTSSAANAAFVWQPTIGLNNVYTAQPTFSDDTTRKYTLTVTAGGCTKTDTVTVLINKTIPLNFTATPTQIQNQNPPYLVTFTNQTGYIGNLSYTWDFGDTTTSNAYSPQHTYLHADTFTVKLSAKSINNRCNASVTKTNYIVCKGPNGVEEFYITDNLINLYPNPNTGEFNLEINHLGEHSRAFLTVYNSLGQVVLIQEMLSGTNKINMRERPAGIYKYSLRVEGETESSGKILITK